MVKGKDVWAEWMLRRRHGNDNDAFNELLPGLIRVRDRVLQNASINSGDVVLDIGTGDGLLGFGALKLVGATGKVIFSDISKDLLEVCHDKAKMSEILSQSDFILASADDLSSVQSESINVVTLRSVLIFVRDKELAFSEFYRVLKPGGRLSLFEPINSYFYPEPEGKFGSYEQYDVAAIEPIAGKVRSIFHKIQPTTDPMMNFDEKELLALALKSGFNQTDLELHVSVSPMKPKKWEAFVNTAGNPLVPTIAEAIAKSLSPLEQKEFADYIRPAVETGKGITQYAAVYLRATK